jgi:NAD(P)-dependent dehydrogenase (short-subunit alcohol dehydrogenase family)
LEINLRLENKVALITGAASGMGRAAAELFATEGAKVVMIGRRQVQGDEVAGIITANGGDAVFVQADVSIEDDVKWAVQAAVDKYGKLDVLFNNAGINQTRQGRPDEESTDSWDEIMGVNLRGAYFCIKHVVPEMRKAGGGSIINNSSVLDSQADNNSAASYHASKGGLTALTLKCAVVYAEDNIRANCIEPGAIATEMSRINWDELEDPELIERRSKAQPLKRMGHPMDVAYAALYFASDESAFVTGATLLVDGGQSASYF